MDYWENKTPYLIGITAFVSDLKYKINTVFRPHIAMAVKSE